MNDHQIYQHDAGTLLARRSAGTYRRWSTDHGGVLYALGYDNNVYEHTGGSSWTVDGGGVEPDGTDHNGFLYGLNTTNQQVYEHDGGAGWHVDAGGIGQIATDAGGYLYGLNITTHQVFEHDSGTPGTSTARGSARLDDRRRRLPLRPRRLTNKQVYQHDSAGRPGTPSAAASDQLVRHQGGSVYALNNSLQTLYHPQRRRQAGRAVTTPVPDWTVDSRATRRPEPLLTSTAARSTSSAPTIWQTPRPPLRAPSTVLP